MLGALGGAFSVSTEQGSDDSERSQLKGSGRVDVTVSKGVLESQNASAKRLGRVESVRTNRHSGSAGSDQELSIEIDFGDGRKASRTNSMSETCLSRSTECSSRSEQKAPVEAVQRVLGVGGLSHDPLSVIAKGATDKVVPSDATKANAGKTEALRDWLEEHADKVRVTPKKPPAPEGQEIGLLDFFHKYSSPFADAYCSSKALKPGAQGKSATLEAIVDRMMAVPWADKLKVKLDPGADNSEYRAEKSTLVLAPRANGHKMVEEAGHEGFHSSHQYLFRLFGGKLLDKQTYANLKVDGEVDGVIAEVSIKREMGSSHERPISFQEKGKKDPTNLEEIYARQGREGLHNFLYNAVSSNPAQLPYGQHHLTFYERYKENFEENRRSVEAILNIWEKGGHKREDL